ncbi:hypothetical protein SAMN05216388_100879 [Halorientalis persicus]|jgi:uncharacterized membrane protein|uniref:Uncharacterized protein n=1 Tax=Halorientalis persicus TaxID=1367881 RepID=A0A1H8M0L2_9EURY|nr:hypothetical protein [Halorientalis persicus]SEO10954.1 hypothetical protein SAMN05216388_100879 [Halorientalis persicus]
MKTVRVDEWFHDYLKTEKRDDETMGEALVRLTGAPAPDPDLVAGIISESQGERMKERIAEMDRSSAAAVRDRMADDS